jgi:hypothetical protein
MSHRPVCSGAKPTAEKRDTASARGTPNRLSKRRDVEPLAAPTKEPRWRCLLSSISVAVAPLRNLTGDADQQNFVQAFTDDLVSDLLHHGRGFSLQRAADEAGVLGKTTGAAEPKIEYWSPEARSAAIPGCCESTSGSRMPRPPNISGLVAMNSLSKISHPSRRRLSGGSLGSCTSCFSITRSAAPPTYRARSLKLTNVLRVRRLLWAGSCGQS